MSKSFGVSFFVGESTDEEIDTYIGTRFIPYIYELIKEHKGIVFLLPYGWATSNSVARTVRVVAKMNSGNEVHCRMVGGYSVGNLCEKMVDASDLLLFYIENHNEQIYNIMNYAKEKGKEYILMK